MVVFAGELAGRKPAHPGAAKSRVGRGKGGGVEGEEGREEKGALRGRKSQKPGAPEIQGLRGLGVCLASPGGSQVTH